jgi:hypothetical protein
MGLGVNEQAAFCNYDITICNNCLVWTSFNSCLKQNPHKGKISVVYSGVLLEMPTSEDPQEKEKQQLAKWAKDYETTLSKVAADTLSNKAQEIAVLRELGNITHPLLTVIPPGGQKFVAAMRVHRSGIVPYVIWFFEDEYSGFISSMVIGAYSNAVRTLRWMLELAVWVCEFHTDPARWKAQDVEREATKSKTTSEITDDQTWESPALRAFNERLYMSEQFRGPHFSQVLGLLGGRQIFSEISGGSSEIGELYSALSRRVHFSLATSFDRIERDLRKPFSPHLGGYDENLFNDSFSLALQVIDKVYFLLIWAQISYYGYSSLREYVGSESSLPFIAGTTPLMKTLGERGLNLEMSFPFLWHFLQERGALRSASETAGNGSKPSLG